METDTLSMIFKLLLSCLLGGLIGYERDVHGREAGLRTQILVSMGSCLFMLISLYMSEIYNLKFHSNDSIKVDPGRIAAQIVTGIGFLGAGAIIKSGINIKGLTTAGCIWVSASIGMATGLGYHIAAVSATGLSLITLTFMNKIEQLYEKDSFRNLKICVEESKNIINNILSVVKESGIDIRYCEYQKNYSEKTVNITFVLRIRHKGITDSLSYHLIENIEKNIQGIKSIAWERIKS